MNNSHGLNGTQRESGKKKWYFFSDGFGLRSPVIQKTYWMKTALTSIIEGVFYKNKCFRSSGFLNPKLRNPSNPSNLANPLMAMEK